MKIVTLSYGSENSWTFGTCNSSRTYNSYVTQIEECCQPQGTYELACLDSYGDGWHGGYIEVGRTKYCENFYGSVEKHNVTMTSGTLNFKHVCGYIYWNRQIKY